MESGGRGLPAASWAVLAGSWGRLGGVGGFLGWSWGVLAAKTDQERGDPVFWDPLGAILAAFWAVLAASCGRLAVLATSWTRLGLVLAAEIGPQVDQTSTQKSIRTLMPLGIDFLKDFIGFYFPKWRQDASKNQMEIDVNVERLFFKKRRFSLRKNMILVVLEAQLRTA